MEARKTEIAMRDCIKSDPERVWEEWEKLIDRMNWRLQRENEVRENERNNNDNGERIHGQVTPDDSDAKKIITTKCNLTLV